MNIAIVSDSHGDLFMLDKAIESLNNVDMIIHLGDHYEDMIKLNEKYNKEIIYVSGNNDWDKGETSLKEKVIDIKGIKIFMTHGHRYSVNYGVDRIFYKGKEVGADIVLFGHTHKQFYETTNNLALFNPGSISYPRDIGRGLGLLHINNGEYTISPIRI